LCFNAATAEIAKVASLGHSDSLPFANVAESDVEGRRPGTVVAIAETAGFTDPAGIAEGAGEFGI
jgi:hypothetical protein